MRQFVLDKSDEEASENVSKKSEVIKPPVMTRKQHPIRLLSKPPKVRMVTPDYRKAIISNIIK